MKKIDFKIKIPDKKRRIYARWTYDESKVKEGIKQPLVVFCTGFNSNIEKNSHTNLVHFFNQQGFSTLQFNFCGHGKGVFKSDGSLNEVTLTTGIEDLTAVWNYTRNHLSATTDIEHMFIHANSYGALVSLLAVESGKIQPQSMVLVSPFSFDKFRPYILPISMISKIFPNFVHKVTGLPISDAMVQDIQKNHRHFLENINLGKTPVYFFIGSDDPVADPKTIEKWWNIINKTQKNSSDFIGGWQAHLGIYRGAKHFILPKGVQRDINRRSLEYFNGYRNLRKEQNR